MNEHRYILEPYKGINTRYHCPSCQQRDKTFSRYIDTETGEHIHPSVGRCSRENNCSYHYTPKQYFQDNIISFDKTQKRRGNDEETTRKQHNVHYPFSLIPVEVFKASLKGHETNHFVTFLIDLFGVAITSELISRYFIATSKHWNGATVFWQIDMLGKIRTGKIMLYSPATGKRIKEPYKHIAWVHKVIKQPEFELKQCLFGEHLLIDKTKPVAIVESEKTAVIASVYFPQLIWVAVGSLNGLNAEKCTVLKGRTVILFPDLNGFEKWSSKIKELSHLATFKISELLERKATHSEREQGFDLADYLIRFDCRNFTEAKILTESDKSDTIKKEHPAPLQNPITERLPDNRNETAIKGENWEQEIKELEHYFKIATMPAVPVKLNICSTITNVPRFISSSFAILKANNGKRWALPALEHLQELKQYLALNTN